MGAGAVVAGIPQIPGAAGRQALGGTDPFSMMNQMMDFRQKQQQYQANMEFGRLATQYEGDPAGLSKAAQASPYAGYMQENIRSLAETQLAAAQTKTQGFSQQEIAARTGKINIETGMDVIRYATDLAGNNMSNLMPIAAALAAKLPDNVYKQDFPFISTVIHSMTDGLNPNDPKDQAAYVTRAFKTKTGAFGEDPANAQIALTGRGATTLQTVGGSTYPFQQVFPGGGPGMGVLGGSSGPTVVGGLGAGGEVPPNQLGGQQPPALTPEQAIGGGTPGPVIGPTPPAQTVPTTAAPELKMFQPVEVPAGFAGDGKRLYGGRQPGDGGVPIPAAGAGIDQGVAMSAADQEEEKTQRAEMAKELPSFDAAQQNIGTLKAIDAALNQLQQSGDTFLRPGENLEGRARLANSVDTLANILGFKPPVPVKDVATYQMLRKNLQALTIKLAQTTFGGQREAASTIERISQSLPTLNDSFLGSKMNVAMIRALMQRQIDLREYQRAWIGDHGRTVIGATERFAQDHPIEQYIDRELKPYGLDSTMKFTDPASVVADQKAGLLTPKAMRDILRDQWGPAGR